MIRRRFGSLRFRIAFAYFVGALIVSGFVAGSTYALVSAFLTSQRIDSITRQSFNSLRFAAEFIERPAAHDELDQLASFLQTRGTSELLLVDRGEPIASSLSVAVETIPSELKRAVEDGEVGYAVFGDEPRRVVFGSQIPGTSLQVYFAYSLRELDDTLGLIARILMVVVSFAVVAAGVVGVRLAGRTIEPLSRAGEAAQRVAEGLLDTRLEERDKDEVGLLAASFNSMAAALQERIARERRFVSDASHELRTPLTTLKASIDYLAEHASELSPPLQQVAGLAASEVRSLQRVVDDLLELSRAEAGAVELQDTDLDLSDFVHEVVRHRAANQPVQVQGPPDGLVVRTDKMRLERVVGNLVENAVQHGQRDVRVVVETQDGHPAVIVADAGDGIPQSDLHRIFERFWRADTARHRTRLGGAGLGLSIARENATILGATLEVDSMPGATQFTVRLPARSYLGSRAQAFIGSPAEPDAP